MICYHGSDLEVEDPKILNNRRPLDFGGGFYVTTNEIQARNWAFKVGYRNNTRKSVINIYEFDFENAKKELSIIHFAYADEKWLNFVCANRNGHYFEDYDIVIGPVADDKVYKVIVEYENNDINVELALQKLKTEKLCDQILFHTHNSLKYLKFLGSKEIDYE